MRADYINPFIASLVSTFDTMLGCEARRGQLQLKQNNKALHEISGVIGLSGRAVGTVVVSLSNDVARHASAAMLMMTPEEVAKDDIVDAVGEITNMVAGAAKAQLEEYELSISLPNVVTGAGHEIAFPKDVPPLAIPFHTKWGELTLEVGLCEVAAPVGN